MSSWAGLRKDPRFWITAWPPFISLLLLSNWESELCLSLETTGDSGCISVCVRSPHWHRCVHPHTPSWLTRYWLWGLQADANPLWNKGVSYKIYWCLTSGEDSASSLLPITLRTKSRGQIGYCGTWNQAVTPWLSKQSKNCFTFLRLSKAH